jgi:hypothetical protein
MRSFVAVNIRGVLRRGQLSLHHRRTSRWIIQNRGRARSAPIARKISSRSYRFDVVSIGGQQMQRIPTSPPGRDIRIPTLRPGFPEQSVNMTMPTEVKDPGNFSLRHRIVSDHYRLQVISACDPPTPLITLQSSGQRVYGKRLRSHQRSRLAIFPLRPHSPCRWSFPTASLGARFPLKSTPTAPWDEKRGGASSMPLATSNNPGIPPTGAQERA